MNNYYQFPLGKAKPQDSIKNADLFFNIQNEKITSCWVKPSCTKDAKQQLVEI
jgi:hypothetical protein